MALLTTEKFQKFQKALLMFFYLENVQGLFNFKMNLALFTVGVWQPKIMVKIGLA